jgi:Kef-type K+ transport system membrane component KefB
MINILGSIIIVAIAVIVKNLIPEGLLDNTTTYALGIVMLTGYMAGKITRKIDIPAITGYILAGILVGPYVLQVITPGNVKDLQMLNGLALSLIALTAGGEIKYRSLKKNIKVISSILISQVIFIVLGMVAVVLFLPNIFSFFADTTVFPNIGTLIAAGLMIGVISTASAPSTTLAVIVESNIKNRYTELILSIVMLKDIIILFLFVVCLSFSHALVGGDGFETSGLLTVFLEIAGSFVCGIVIGAIILLYLKIKKRNDIFFILAICFFSNEIFESLHLHPLLIMMIAGFVVENFSSRGEKLIMALEAISPPVYTLFFCLIGASITLPYLKTFLPLTLVFVLLRIVLTYSGSYVGGTLAGKDNFVKNKSWMAFISQAGVSLGMAKIVEQSLGAFGDKMFTLIVSLIVMNEIIGPLLLKRFVDQSKGPANLEQTEMPEPSVKPAPMKKVNLKFPEHSG